MLRTYGSFFEQVAAVERPVLPLFAALNSTNSPYPKQGIEERRPDRRYFHRSHCENISAIVPSSKARLAHQATAKASTPSSARPALGPLALPKQATPSRRAFHIARSQRVFAASFDEVFGSRVSYSVQDNTRHETNSFPTPEEAERQRQVLFEDEDGYSQAVAETGLHVEAGSSTSDSKHLLEGSIDGGPNAVSRKHRLVWERFSRRAFGDPQQDQKIASRPIPGVSSSESESQAVSRLWLIGCNAIRKALQKPHSLGRNLPPSRNKVALQWMDEFEGHCSDLDSAQSYWRAMDPEERSGRWPLLVLHYAQFFPEQAFFLLRSIMPSYRPPAQCVADVFDLISGLALATKSRELRVEKTIVTHIWNLLDLVLDHYPSVPSFSQKSIRLALLCLAPTEMMPALVHLRDCGVHIAPEMTLNVTRTMAIAGQSTVALEMLAASLHLGAPPESLLLQTTVAKFVRSSSKTSIGLVAPPDLVARLSELHVPFALPLYNVLILNASETGDVERAWKFYKMIRTNHMCPSEYTYAIMMKMCRIAGDRLGYRQIYHDLDPESRDNLGPRLVAEILQCRQIFNARDNFDHTLRYYERHCDLRPLKDLGILGPDYASRFSEWYSTRPLPSGFSLTIVVLKYMKHKHITLTSITRLYHKFREQVALQNPRIMYLASNNYIWNGFFVALSKSGSFLNHQEDPDNPIHWTKMLRAMTEVPPPGVVNEETGRPFERLVPDEQTWNIILHAHARRGNVAEADRILENMKRNGIEPAVVTWNSLLNGFARFQHLGLVSHVLQQMKDSEISVDDHTARALSHFEDRENLVEAMNDNPLFEPPPEALQIIATRTSSESESPDPGLARVQAQRGKKFRRSAEQLYGVRRRGSPQTVSAIEWPKSYSRIRREPAANSALK